VLSGAAAKRLLVAVGLALVALLLVGFVVGAIGSAILGTPRFVPQPEIHLPPQPVFPASSRELHLGLTTSDHPNEGEATVGEDHGPGEGENAGAGAEEEAHSTPLGITEFAITNTMLSAWFASVVIVLFFVLGAGKKRLVPGRFQSVVESLFEGIINFSSGVLGPEMARRAFPVVATIFFFVLFNAWLALFPFYQFVGFVSGEDNVIQVHLLRSAGTDLNMPLALALVSFCFVEYWGFRANGFAYLKKFFAFGSIFRRGIFQGLIDMFVGFLELVSELIRVVSFTFRLFGNMTAGEILVVMITFLVPFVVTNFVYGLELLVGLIQSVIFAGLTLVFLSVAVRHEEH
jgi:F-type H+-transporting ATPase subunit a